MKKSDIDKAVFIFVYGSLKRGFFNSGLLSKEKLIAKAITDEKYCLYPSYSYWYPYAIEKDKNFQILGELYELKSIDISAIDELEDAPQYYYRKIIDVTCDNKKYKAYMYFKNENSDDSEYDTNIAMKTWIKEFENVAKINDEFTEAYHSTLRILKKS